MCVFSPSFLGVFIDSLLAVYVSLAHRENGLLVACLGAHTVGDQDVPE